jgi:Mce-associated membrane protein
MTETQAVVIDERDLESHNETGENGKVRGGRCDRPIRRIPWTRVLAFGVLPALALLLAMGAGYLKWLDASVRDSQVARVESVHMAVESTIAMLSYKPDTVEQDLGAARDRLTGEFKDAYTSLTNDVVIPGAKQKKITAVANVPAAASVSASQSHAVVLVFVNQIVTIGNDPPTNTASSVRVTLDKVGARWMISQFDPV